MLWHSVRVVDWTAELSMVVSNARTVLQDHYGKDLDVPRYGDRTRYGRYGGGLLPSVVDSLDFRGRLLGRRF